VWNRASRAVLAWGLPGLLLLAFLDSAGMPVVGGVDVLLVSLATTRPSDAYWAALLATVGSIAGSLVLFFIARKGGEALLMRHIAGKTGARLHMWFQRYGLFTVFVPAISPLPMPMKIPVFCAGALQVRASYFLVVVAVARSIRYFALAYLSRHYGRETFRYLGQHIWQTGLCALGLALAVAVGLWLYQRNDVEEGVTK
jgi:membrane protein YqaA with SNARE-associated domain